MSKTHTTPPPSSRKRAAKQKPLSKAEQLVVDSMRDISTVVGETKRVTRRAGIAIGAALREIQKRNQSRR